MRRTVISFLCGAGAIGVMMLLRIMHHKLQWGEIKAAYGIHSPNNAGGLNIQMTINAA
jgi:hypothetical protein